MNSKFIINEIQNNGIYVYKNFVSDNQIKVLKSNFEKLLKQKKYVWSDNQNSDNRIFGIDILDPIFSDVFIDDCLNEIYSKYISSTKRYSFVMANRLEFKKNNLGSGGGWHRDTFFSKQLKFILYLSDVGDDNGPFEYLPKSHYKSHKLKDIISRFQQKNIRRYADKNFNKVKKIIGKAGDLIIVDTSGIHRGSPIQNGLRFALTNYLSHKPFSTSLTSELPVI